MTLNDYTGYVLVVDDEEVNREMLRDMLESKGYRVTEAVDGEQSLQLVAKEPPDVILLDVMLPGMDGFAVCRQLKEDPHTAQIPILLITALTERRYRLTGIEAGADDFLSKPIDTQDVILRVRNAVYTKHLFDQLQENYQQLRELETLRDNLTHMIVHDLRSPLMGVIGYLELISMRTEGTLDAKTAEDLKKAIDIAGSFSRMITSLLDVSRLEAGEMPLHIMQCDLSMVAQEAIATLGSLIEQRPVAFEPPPEPVWVSCDPELIRRVIANLVSNALNFTPRNGEVRIQMEGDNAQVWVRVMDTGHGIPPEYHKKIFEKFGQMETRQEGRKYSTGLGLTFCKLAVEAHGGTIGVESTVGKGSTFWFVLPMKT